MGVCPLFLGGPVSMLVWSERPPLHTNLVVLLTTCLVSSLTSDSSFSPGPIPLSASAPFMGIGTFLVTGDAQCLFLSSVFLFLDVKCHHLYSTEPGAQGVKQICHLPQPHLESKELILSTPG